MTRVVVRTLLVVACVAFVAWPTWELGSFHGSLGLVARPPSSPFFQRVIAARAGGRGWRWWERRRGASFPAARVPLATLAALAALAAVLPPHVLASLLRRRRPGPSPAEPDAHAPAVPVGSAPSRELAGSASRTSRSE